MHLWLNDSRSFAKSFDYMIGWEEDVGQDDAVIAVPSSVDREARDHPAGRRVQQRCIRAIEKVMQDQGRNGPEPAPGRIDAGGGPRRSVEQRVRVAPRGRDVASRQILDRQGT